MSFSPAEYSGNTSTRPGIPSAPAGWIGVPAVVLNGERIIPIGW